MEIAQKFRCDVLVIGGGGAALQAAWQASLAGSSVIVVEKGQIGTAGATVSQNSDSLAWQMADRCSDNTDSPDQHAQNIIDVGLGMADPSLAHLLAEEVVPVSKELEDLGLRFIPDPMDPQRHYTGYSCFGDRPRAHGLLNSGFGHGGDVVQLLLRLLADRRVDLHHQVFISDLLVDDGQCYGALGLNEQGEMLLYRAHATVIATGGAWQMFAPEPTKIPIGTTGDGYAMGYRCGAELTNMEFMQYMLHRVMPFDVEVPGVFWALNPELFNAEGRSVLGDYLPEGVTAETVMQKRTEHYPFSTRDASKWLDIAIASELAAGRGNEDGSLSLDFRKADLKNFVPSRPQHIPENFSKRPVVPDHLVRIRIASHAINGGLLIGKEANTSIAGLYAAGEVAAGPHGADRLGGGMVSAGQVFGKRAGQAASAFAKNNGLEGKDLQHALKVAMNRIDLLRNSSQTLDPLDLRTILQRHTSNYFSLLRSRDKLKELQQKILQMRHEFLPQTKSKWAKDLAQALELDNLLYTVEMMGSAAMAREESRGGHYRTDFPVQDDESWLYNLLITVGDDGPILTKRRLENQR